MSGALDAAHALALRTAPWEIARTVPFLLATGLLLWIAVRLRQGDARALFVARQWTLAAFGVIAVSLLIQVVAIVPPTMEYQRQVVETIPTVTAGKGAAPFDVKQMMSSMMVVGAVFGVVTGTLFLSAWPVVLRVWAGRLIRETLPPREAG